MSDVINDSTSIAGPRHPTSGLAIADAALEERTIGLDSYHGRAGSLPTADGVDMTRLDREHLEAIVLDLPRCCEAPLALEGAERDRRLRQVLSAAHELLVHIASQAIAGRPFVDSPTLVKQYLAVHFAEAEREVFVSVFLDKRLRVIAAETLFVGTLTQTSVYPREVVRRALHRNAAAVVLAHNHLTGLAKPSLADEYLTQQLQGALMLVDVRVIDHIIVAGSSAVSFAERGLV
jgi:DNA repair protein RadC